MKPHEPDDHQTFLSDDHATQLSTDQATMLSSAEAARAPAPRPALSAGVDFGPYRIVRLLGRGGMGEVYEAEELEHGRRVALKVLSQRLTSQADRARFLTEGQLAASISHPNSVYVFGSEVIDGAPVITMELLPGGTLKDLVEREGPLPPASAVDAIVQVIAGLEAAHRAGILHRDVKPSNCFVDADGVVKVGDFGLSISTQARHDEAGPRTFQGTPHFAAPEQIAGDALDVRADLYAVGATLYYLLTGTPPFDDRDLARLLDRVKQEPPASPRAQRPSIPAGLDRVVLQLLAKEPASRVATYADLAQRLHAYESAAPTPAGPGLRFTAGLIDHVLLTLATTPLMMTTAWRLSDDQTANASFSRPSPLEMSWETMIGYVLWLTYYMLLEGVGNASLGKRVCGLRVAEVSGRRASLARVAARTALFMLPNWVTAVPMLLVGPAELVILARTYPWLGGLYAVSLYLLTALLFVSMRRGNGFAGVHDLLTNTRVLVRQRREARPVIDATSAGSATRRAHPSRQHPRAGEMVGPFEVGEPIASTDRGELVLGRDPVLRRPVWLHFVSADVPALPAEVRDLTRPTRLRWLGGRRSSGENWDAYEAPDGHRLVALCRKSNSWAAVKHWIADLTAELGAAERDRTLPPLSLDRVWITRGGHAKLLDFEIRSDESQSDWHQAAMDSNSPQRFLGAVARVALSGEATKTVTTDAAPARPLPLSARTTIEQLSADGFATLADAGAAATRLASEEDRVSRWRRAVPLVFIAMPMVIATIGISAVVPLLRQATQPEFLLFSACLSELESPKSKVLTTETQRQALETFVAGRFGPHIKDERFWQSTGLVLAKRRPIAERAVANHSTVSEAELAAATAQLQPFLDERERNARPMSLGALGALMVLLTITVIGALCFVLPVIFRGSVLLRLAGVATVAADGAPASRLRMLWRGLIAWSPVMAVWLLVYVGAVRLSQPNSIAPIVAACAVLAAGALWAIVRPDRGVQDRLAGTWLVPR